MGNFLNTVLLFFAVLAACAEVKVEERLDIDPVLQGVWKLHITSNDGGKTLENKGGSVIARVSATTVKLVGGGLLVAEKIVIFKDNAGNPGNMIMFRNGVVWVITKKPDQSYVLVQCMVDGKKESLRLLVTVEQ